MAEFEGAPFSTTCSTSEVVCPTDEAHALSATDTSTAKRCVDIEGREGKEKNSVQRFEILNFLCGVVLSCQLM